MFTPGARKARSRVRRNVSRLKPVAAAAIADDAAPEFAEEAAVAPEAAELAPAPEEHVLELGAEDAFAEDEFILGADDVLAPDSAVEAGLADDLLTVGETGLMLGDGDEDIPFDAPEEDDEIFQVRRVIYDPAADRALQANKQADALAGARAHQDEQLRSTPPISVFVSWERDEARDLVTALSRDRRLSRAEFTFERGGLEGAVGRFDDARAPDLLIVDTALPREKMLDGAAALAHLVRRGVKIVLLGAVNDINLLRDLGARGVSEYVMPPIEPEEFVRTICRLYADAGAARTIAVIGARGGVGASTIAHNIAWSIAERQERCTALVDFDLAFGTAAFAFNQSPAHSIAEVLVAPDHADDDLLDGVAVRPTKRLRIYSAPASVERALRLDPRAVEHTLAHVRRTSAWIVLDLPHDWTAWVKQTLLTADQAVIVATPDLAGLAAAKSMLEALKSARPQIDPLVVVSMAGVPKRPEIAAKEFAEALGAAPACTVAFDPELVGKAAVSAQMIGEVAPHSKMAQMLDDLAATITGGAPVNERAAAKAEAPAAPPAHDADGGDASVRGVLRRLKMARGVTVRKPAAPGESYLAQARRAAAAQLSQAPKPAPRDGASPLPRIAALATAVVALSAWHIEGRRSEAEASVAPQVATVTAHAAPAAPVRDPSAEYEAAAQLLETNAAEALPLLQRLADEGVVAAQYRLAKAYELGEGAAPDLAQARRWTERAAAAGHPHAMHDLGVFYAQGDGGDADAAAAFLWFRRAAAQGVADSQYNLGVLYEQGRGVSKDTAEALFWFALAARQGDEAAAARANALARELTPLQVEQARARAAAFRTQRPA